MVLLCEFPVFSDILRGLSAIYDNTDLVLTYVARLMHAMCYHLMP